MGAVQFVLNKDEKEKQKIYPSEIQILNCRYLNSSTFKDDISRFVSSNLSEVDIKNIIEKYDPKNKECKLTGLKYPEDTILLYATGLIIQNNKILENKFEIFKFIQRIYQNLDITEDEIEKCKIVEERFQKEFDMDMKFLKYDITKGTLQKLPSILYMAFNNNFSLREIFQPNIITVILNEQILTNVELIESLAETIRYCNTLQIVNFI